MVFYIYLYYVLLFMGVYFYEHYGEQMGRWRRTVLLCVKRLSIYAVIKMKRICNAIWSCLSKGESQMTIFKMLCYVGIFVWLIWTFENCWYSWYCEHIASYLKISGVFAYFLLAVYCLLLIVSSILYGLYKRPVRIKAIWYMVLAVLVLYIRYRFCTNYFEFTPLSYIETRITYIDVIVVAFIIYVIALIRYEKHRQGYLNAMFPQEEEFFYLDAPWEEGDPDWLGFHKHVSLHVEKIETLTRNRSWTVGVVGPWGSGKTSYISMLKKGLPDEKYLVIPFNPRFAAKPSKIQELALEELANALKPYYSGIRSLMRKYMSALQLDGTNSWVQVLISIIKSASDVAEIKKELQNILEKLPKQVVFVIDDFDRLTKEEILEVLKLIDGNANFKNIIYIAAYDHEQMEKLLGESYIDKYFSIEIHVPLSRLIDLINYLRGEIKKIVPAPLREDKLVISGENVLLHHWNVLFRRAILTMRDAKRYLNILRSDILTIYSRNVETEDFMLLSLLKYNNTRLYEMLYTMPSKYLQFKEVITVNTGAEDYKKLDSLDQDILSKLFPTIPQDNDRPSKIRKRKNFDYYFIRPDETVGRIELSELFDLSLEELQLQIKIEAACKKETIAKDFLTNFEQFGRRYIDDKQSFRRFLLIVLYFNRYGRDTYAIPETWDIFRDAFYSTINELRNKRFNHKEISSVILEYYANNNWTIGDIGVLEGIVPELYYEKKKRDYVIKREEMEPIIRKRFSEECEVYLNSQVEEDFERLISIFYLCISRIDGLTSKIWLDEDCCKRMREVILQAPKAYVDNFVMLGGESSSPEVNHVGCEGFWEQIFGSVDELVKFMKNLDEEHFPRLRRMRNFWRLYEANDYKMIRFEHQGNVQEIINNDMVEEVRELEELRDMERQIKDAMSLNGSALRIAVANQIIEQIDRIPLQVAYKGRMRNMAEQLKR